MNFTEINPGIVIYDNGEVRKLLQRCPCCGGTDLISHVKYSDKCVDCGNLYNAYSVRRSARRKGAMSKSSLETHLSVIEELVSRRDAGLSVPKTLDSERAATTELLSTIEKLQKEAAAEALKNTHYVDITCRHCGDVVCIPENLASKNRGVCESCIRTREEYKKLCRSIFELTLDECLSLGSIIERYIALHNKGFRTPKYTHIIEDLQARVVEVGGTRFKFYKKKV